jgi:hypothetical protein
VPCIALHAAYNTALSLLAHYETGAEGGDAQGPESAGFWIASLMLAAVGVLYLVRAFDRPDSRGER